MSIIFILSLIFIFVASIRITWVCNAKTSSRLETYNFYCSCYYSNSRRFCRVRRWARSIKDFLIFSMNLGISYGFMKITSIISLFHYKNSSQKREIRRTARCSEGRLIWLSDWLAWILWFLDSEFQGAQTRLL